MTFSSWLSLHACTTYFSISSKMISFCKIRFYICSSVKLISLENCLFCSLISFVSFCSNSISLRIVFIMLTRLFVNSGLSAGFLLRTINIYSILSFSTYARFKFSCVTNNLASKPSILCIFITFSYALLSILSS